jgi:hypothetical protein
LGPQQLHGVALVDGDIDALRAQQASGLVGRNNSNVVLMKAVLRAKWLANQDDCLRLRPEQALIG